MAGNYPDPPSYRMRYDADGSQLFWLADGSSSPAAISNANARAMNDESDGSQPSYGTNGRVVIIFPELRDLDAYFADIGGYAYSYRYPATLETSVDTTNGYDGTWVSQGNWQSQTTPPNWRKNVVGLSVLGIRAVRFRETAGGAITSTTWATLHLYGEPSSPSGDRLELWDPVLDQKLGHAALEYGDRQRGSVTTKTFRVKNKSATQRAVNVRVAMDTLTDANPSLPSQHQLSTDGSTWLAQVTLGNLEPGAVSGVIQQRQSLASNAQLSIWNVWTFAEATSWEAV